MPNEKVAGAAAGCSVDEDMSISASPPPLVLVASVIAVGAVVVVVCDGLLPKAEVVDDWPKPGSDMVRWTPNAGLGGVCWPKICPDCCCCCCCCCGLLLVLPNWNDEDCCKPKGDWVAVFAGVPEEKAEPAKPGEEGAPPKVNVAAGLPGAEPKAGEPGALPRLTGEPGAEPKAG